MKLSVIIPAYNCADTIGATLNSVLTQQEVDLELIVVNDGSTDGTQTLLEEYAARDERLRPLQIPNGGPSNARNVGIREATGDYLTFVDSDDLLCPRMYAEMLSLAEREDLDEVACGYRMEQWKGGRPISEKSFGYEAFVAHTPEEFGARLIGMISAHLMYAIWNKVYRTSILRENGILFPLEYKSGEDRLFNTRIFPHIRRFGFVNQPFYRYLNDEKGLNGRFVANRFDAALECHLTLVETCRQMNIYDETAAAALDFQFIKGIMSCFTQLSGKDCPWTGKEKKAYIKTVLQQQAVQDAIRKNNLQGGYAAIVTAILRTGNTMLIRLLAWGILFLQQRLNGLYLAIKHRK